MLDTDTASYLIKGTAPALERRLLRLDAAQVCISAVTRGELRYGVARLPQATRLAAEVERFLSGIPVLAWGDAAADCYGQVRAGLEHEGAAIGSLDMLIAAHALAADLILISNNTRHFSRVAALRLENWM